jgi:hypothetical protein
MIASKFPDYIFELGELNCLSLLLSMFAVYVEKVHVGESVVISQGISRVGKAKEISSSMRN